MISGQNFFICQSFLVKKKTFQKAGVLFSSPISVRSQKMESELRKNKQKQIVFVLFISIIFLCYFNVIILSSLNKKYLTLISFSSFSLSFLPPGIPSRFSLYPGIFQFYSLSFLPPEIPSRLSLYPGIYQLLFSLPSTPGNIINDDFKGIMNDIKKS